jgi:hypothetical protein
MFGPFLEMARMGGILRVQLPGQTLERTARIHAACCAESRVSTCSDDREPRENPIGEPATRFVSYPTWKSTPNLAIPSETATACDAALSEEVL